MQLYYLSMAKYNECLAESVREGASERSCSEPTRPDASTNEDAAGVLSVLTMWENSREESRAKREASAFAGREHALRLSRVGTELLQNSRWREAADTFSVAVRAAPENPAYHAMASMALMRAGDPELAFVRAHTALRLEATDLRLVQLGRRSFALAGGDSGQEGARHLARLAARNDVSSAISEKQTKVITVLSTIGAAAGFVYVSDFVDADASPKQWTVGVTVGAVTPAVLWGVLGPLFRGATPLSEGDRLMLAEKRDDIRQSYERAYESTTRGQRRTSTFKSAAAMSAFYLLAGGLVYGATSAGWLK